VSGQACSSDRSVSAANPLADLVRRARASAGWYNSRVLLRGITLAAIAIAALLLAAACGGKTERDWVGSGTGEPTGSGGGDDGGASDASAGGSAGAAPSTGGAANAGAGGSAAPVQANCDSLAVFAGGQRISDHPARQALFSASLDRAVLRVEDAVLVVSLPSGEITELAVPDVNSIEWAGQVQQQVLATLDSQELLLMPLDGEPSTVLASSVCSHAAAPDWGWLYVVSDCDEPTSTLSIVDLETGMSDQLAESLSIGGVIVSADGRWVAYATEDLPDQPCSSSNLQVLDATGEQKLSLAHTDRFPPQFLANGLLLAGRALSCEEWELVLYAPEQDALIQLSSSASPGWRSVPLSLEQQIVLGERFDFEAATTEPGELVAISLTGEGETVLASNLYPYHAEQLRVDAYRPFALTADGQHAVYVSAEPSGLSAVPTSGGLPIVLARSASGYGYVLSPADPDQIVFLERVGERPDYIHEVRLGSVSTGSSRIIYSSSYPSFTEPAFLPDGRGLLIVDNLARLLFVPSSGDSVVLADNVDTFEMNTSGCVALYVTDEPDAATHLVQIPQDTP
jgi:hypothetical protein